MYGLRNDLRPAVFWYNKALIDQFGYTIPTTWEEYQALGDKVAAEHPGYIVGSVGDASSDAGLLLGRARRRSTSSTATTFSSRHLG